MRKQREGREPFPLMNERKKKMKTYWQRNDGIIYIYTGNSKPYGEGWHQVTKNDYTRALNEAWAKREEQRR